MTRNDEHQKRQRTRKLVVGGVLVALVILFYLITVVKMSGGAGA